jgi:ankyrin repeat protein
MALQVAAYRGNLEIVNLLLEKGVDPNVQSASFVIRTMCDWYLQAVRTGRHSKPRWLGEIWKSPKFFLKGE